jgi:hypothetical protein
VTLWDSWDVTLSWIHESQSVTVLGKLPLLLRKSPVKSTKLFSAVKQPPWRSNAYCGLRIAASAALWQTSGKHAMFNGLQLFLHSLTDNRSLHNLTHILFSGKNLSIQEAECPGFRVLELRRCFSTGNLWEFGFDVSFLHGLGCSTTMDCLQLGPTTVCETMIQSLLAWASAEDGAYPNQLSAPWPSAL